MSGSRGPLSKPRGLKLVPAAEAEVVAASLADEVTPGAPDQPEGMSDAGKKVWDALVPQLDDLGLVCQVDGLTIDLAIRHYLAALKASDELTKSKSVSLRDEKNERQQKHPADAVFRLHSEMFLKYADKLGMTFVSRARLAARGGAGDGDENPFAPRTPAAGGS